jgi:hypothetical protein
MHTPNSLSFFYSLEVGHMVSLFLLLNKIGFYPVFCLYVAF